MPTLPGLIDDAIEEVSKGDWDAIQGLLNIARGASEIVVTADALESEAGPDAAPAEIATDATGGFVVVVLLIVVFPLIVLAIVLAGARKTIGGIAVVGGPVGGLLGYVVSWLRTLIRHAAEHIESEIGHAWKTARDVYHLWLRLEDVPTRTYVSDQNAAQNHHFTKWMNHLQSDIAGINHTLYHKPGGLVAHVAAEQADLHYINAEMGKVWHEINKLHVSDESALRHTVRQLTTHLYDLQNEVHKLEREFHAPLPHTPITLPRIEHDEKRIADVETVVQRLQHEIDVLRTHPQPGRGMTAQQERQLSYSHSIATELAPLTALRPFTGNRVDNLRKLEDKPCQCPALSLGGGGILDGIVADLVLKDGI